MYLGIDCQLELNGCVRLVIDQYRPRCDSM